MCAKDECLKLAFESAFSASVAPLRRSYRIRGVNQGPDSELVVLFLCKFQVVDVALKDVPAGRHPILCSQQNRFRSRDT